MCRCAFIKSLLHFYIKSDACLLMYLPPPSSPLTLDFLSGMRRSTQHGEHSANLWTKAALCALCPYRSSAQWPFVLCSSEEDVRVIFLDLVFCLVLYVLIKSSLMAMAFGSLKELLNMVWYEVFWFVYTLRDVQINKCTHLLKSLSSRWENLQIEHMVV